MNNLEHITWRTKPIFERFYFLKAFPQETGSVGDAGRDAIQQIAHDPVEELHYRLWETIIEDVRDIMQPI
jgi:hypothetical protein